jgi:hypothetical protein
VDSLSAKNDMNLFDATIFGYTAWRVYSSAALLLMYAGLKFHWSREAARESAGGQTLEQNEVNVPLRPIRKDPSTMNLSDTQRIDQLHRVVSLQAGEHADLKDLTFDRLSRFRVLFAGIEHESGQDFAHIKVELGGATADCGSAVQELGENDFLVPRATLDDQQCSIHYMCGKNDAVSFLQIKVPRFDEVAQSAKIDVLHVRGRRAA